MEISHLPMMNAENSSLISSPCSLFSVNQSRLLSLSHCRYHLFIRNSQIQKAITCARNKRRRYGSARSTKLMLESAYYIASKLKILPEPLDSLIKEFSVVGGGNGGGGFGFWKGSGWGGFDGWGRRRRKRKIELLGIFVTLGIGMWLILGKELKTDVFLLGILGLFLLVYGWRKTVLKDRIMGFSSCAVLVGLGLKQGDFQRWMKNFEALKVSFRRRKKTAF